MPSFDGQKLVGKCRDAKRMNENDTWEQQREETSNSRTIMSQRGRAAGVEALCLLTGVLVEKERVVRSKSQHSPRSPSSISSPLATTTHTQHHSDSPYSSFTTIYARFGPYFHLQFTSYYPQIAILDLDWWAPDCPQFFIHPASHQSAFSLS